MPRPQNKIKQKNPLSIIRVVVATLYIDLSGEKNTQIGNNFIENPQILQDSNAVNMALQRIGLDK